MATPNKPTSRGSPKEDPFKIISLGISELRNHCLKSNDPKQTRELIRQVDDLLKEIANLQSESGKIRREMVSHEGNLRQERPKGRPAEGTIKVTPNGSYIYLDGAYQPYLGKTDEHEESKEV